MKRDWELIRLILMKLEECESSAGVLRSSDVEGYDAEIVSYHMWLLKGGGLITAVCKEAVAKPVHCIAQNLTWEGHEFLDKVRSHTAWNKVKGLAREKGLDLTLDVIKLAAKVAIESVLR
jgi:hypothetical protein